MSRDTQRDLDLLSRRQPRAGKTLRAAVKASNATKPLRKEIIRAIRDLPRNRALELVGELAASKHGLPPANDVDVGQFGGPLLARCSIEELRVLRRRLRPD